MLPIAVAVVEHQGQVLIGPRAAALPLGGLWEFPGGKIVAGETPAEGAVRECREETGLDVEVVALDSIVEHQYEPAGQRPLAVRLHFFRCRPCQHTQHTQAPRPPFCWTPTSALASYEFPAANRALIQRLMGQSKPVEEST